MHSIDSLPWEQFGAALLLTSGGLLNTVLNKYIVSGLKLRCRIFILFIQTAFIVFLIALLITCGLVEIKPVEASLLLLWAPNSIFLALMTYTGIQAIEKMTISMITVLKNLTIVLVVFYDVKYAGYVLNPYTLLSFFLIFASSVLGSFSGHFSALFRANSASDEREKQSPGPHFLVQEGVGSESEMEEHISVAGIYWISLNCVCTAVYTIHLRHSVRSYGVGNAEATFYTNLLATPLFLLGACVSDRQKMSKPGAFTLTTSLWICASGVSSFMIAYAYSWASKVFSSTTLSMIGSLNKLPISVSGILCGMEEVGSFVKWISIVLGALSALIYSYSRQLAAAL